MSISRTFLLSLLITVIVGCSRESAVVPPPGWIKVGNTKFSFYIPGDMKLSPERGSDSFFRQYKNDDMSLSFNYGCCSDSLDHYSGEKNYSEKTEEINGKQAKIVFFVDVRPPRIRPPKATQSPHFKNRAGIYFPIVGSGFGKGGDTKLTIGVSYRTEADRATVEQIFKTIRFSD